MSTQDTSHNATNPDPTPRTAATAREHDWDFNYQCLRCLRYEHDPRINEPCPGIALAAAEAPGRVAAMEAAKQEGGATGDELSAHTYQPEVNR